ncbi:hypothetical protein BKA70DRAFT_1400775 [Coprinopsis sp. MPI-PUGE-AT-0042]|nr:hypothetical protein BKA70DRAFT_1400775 [Coprinopsis sp. MPI-PUGE-AT-0042]
MEELSNGFAAHRASMQPTTLRSSRYRAKPPWTSLNTSHSQNHSRISSWRSKRMSASKTGEKATALVQHLSRAIYGDELPTDDTTREVWGFKRAAASHEALPGPNYLLGVYQGLVKHLNISPQVLNQWRQKGILLDEVKKIFEKIPVGFRGEYYPWLLRNEYVLDRSLPIPSSNPEAMTRKPLAEWLELRYQQPPCKRWHHPDHNQILATSEARMHNPLRDAPSLLSSVAQSHHVAAFWMAIVEHYKELLQLATFDEFHQAYGNARLVELLERRGLTQNAAYRRVEGEFKDVVDGSEKGELKSAWRLKEFVENNPGTLEPKQRSEIRNSINVDYGWMNCKDIHQSNKLLRIYRQYFQSPAAK